MALAVKIDKILMTLPPTARREVYDFVEFLSVKYRKKTEAAQEDRNWKLMSATSLDKVWDNSEDEAYNELL